MTAHRKPTPSRRDLPSGDRRISEELKNRILAVRGDQVRKLILYGSRAQGSASPDSDFDLLVVEADPVVPREERRQLAGYWKTCRSRWMFG